MITEPLSLDTPVAEDLTIEDYIACQPEKNPDFETSACFLNCDIEHALNYLENREKIILINRYGLFGKSRKTLEEIGQLLGFSKERIRQIENNAIKKLKLEPKFKHMKAYVS